jgi:SAM-dependent methyltransferase
VRLFDAHELEVGTVALTEQASKAETARAFDAVAGDYDRSNVENPILSHMRRRSVAALIAHVAAGSSIIDLGCGPGTDHRALVNAGYLVTAIDASVEMVRQAQRRAALMLTEHKPMVLCRPIELLGKFAPASFDAAFSNFGPLNCVGDLRKTAMDLRQVLRPGGIVVASVIGRVCPWEIALYLRRGQIGRALLRLRRGPIGVPLKGGTVWTEYVSPSAFARAFEAAGFRTRELRGLGVVAPPPYLDAFARRRARFVETLLAVDDIVGRWPGVRHIGDHFLIVLQRD